MSLAVDLCQVNEATSRMTLNSVTQVRCGSFSSNHVVCRHLPGDSTLHNLWKLKRLTSLPILILVLTPSPILLHNQATGRRRSTWTVHFSPLAELTTTPGAPSILSATSSLWAPANSFCVHRWHSHGEWLNVTWNRITLNRMYPETESHWTECNLKQNHTEQNVTWNRITLNTM